MRRSLAIMENDLALVRLDPLLWVILIATPVIVMAFEKPAFAPLLRSEGYPFANGAEQAVPGLAVTFAFFNVTFAGIAFFREHIWSTWDRLRAQPVSSREILIGKLVPAFLLVCVQQAVLFIVGAGLFDFHSRGPVGALALIDLAFITWVIAFAFLVVAYATTFQQVLGIANLGAIVCGGFGGGLTPIPLLPSWSTDLAHFTPTWWAMRAFNKVVLQGQGVDAIGRSLLMLFVSAGVLAFVAALRFRLNDRKGGTL